MENELILTDELVEEYASIRSEYSLYVEHYVQEGVNIKGVFTKILNAIKRFFSFLGKMISRIFNFLKRNKATKTVDQILESSGIENTKVTTESTISTKTEDMLTVKFPATEDSVIKACELHVYAKDLLIKVENDSYTVEAFGMLPGHVSPGPDKVVNSGFCIGLFSDFLDDHSGAHLKENLENFFDNISVNDNHEITVNDTEKIMMCRESIKKSSDFVKTQRFSYSFTISKFVAVQKLVNDICIKLANINAVDFDKSIQTDIVSTFKSVCVTLDRITFGCNACGRGFGSMYMCDKKYVGTISSIDELSHFVQSCIQSGIPTRYVAYNVWLVLDENLEVNNEIFHLCADGYESVIPRWGQTRVTFLPITSDESVIKVAMNGAGITGNRREVMIYKKYKSAGCESVLTGIKNVTQNFCVLIMERIQSGVSDKDKETFKDKTLVPMYEKNPFLPQIHDIHKKNLGRVNGQIKILDYAGI